MKTNFLLFTLLVPIFLCAQTKQLEIDPQKVIKLEENAGTVYYLPAGTKTFIQARAGQFFPAGTIFKTKKRAMGLFKFLLKGELHLAPRSTFRVEVSYENKLMLWMLNGTAKVKVPDRPHWVLTDNGIGLTRNSTIQITRNRDNKKSGILVYDGVVNVFKVDPLIFDIESLFKIREVAFLDRLKKISVYAGMYSYFTDRVEATLPVKISPLQFEILRTADPFLWIEDQRQLRIIRTSDRLPEGVFSRHFTTEPPNTIDAVPNRSPGVGLYQANGVINNIDGLSFLCCRNFIKLLLCFYLVNSSSSSGCIGFDQNLKRCLLMVCTSRR